MAVPSIAQGCDSVLDCGGGMSGWGGICPQDGQHGGSMNTGLSPAPEVTPGVTQRGATFPHGFTHPV